MIIRRETVLDADTERVWRVVSDPQRLPAWWPGVTRVEDLRDLCAIVDRDDWAEVRAALDHLAVAGVAHPKLFSPTQENA